MRDFDSERALRGLRGARSFHPRPDARRRPIPLAGLIAVLAALALAGCGDRDDATTGERSTPASAARPPRAPNLVLITLDTTRADALGFMGQSRPTSPRIDRLAREGTVFTNALASSPMTLPSHSTILAGQQPYVHGVRSNIGYALADPTVTLSEILAGRGYRTGAEIAVDVLRRETGIGQGFDHFREPSDPDVELKEVMNAKGETVRKSIRTDQDISNRGIEFIRANRERRFFLWLHYFGAHQPHVVPRDLRERFGGESYYAAVAQLDQAVGRVIDEIEAQGLREDTIVLLTADHGEGLGEHDEETHSYFVYDTTMHVPFVFWGPDSIPRGQIRPEVVRTIDMAPTALELIGLSPPDTMEGISLVPLMTGTRPDPGLLAYGESFEPTAFFDLSPIRFVREGRWKYIHKVNPELYDVAADPKELRNRIDDEPEIAARLRDRLEALLREAPAQSGASAVTEIDPAMEAQLQALGYVGGNVTPEGFDEVASLDVRGEDPVDRIETLDQVIRTQHMVDNEEYDEALAVLAPLAKENPDSLYVMQRLAWVQAARGAEAEAIDAYRRVLALDRCNLRALTEMNGLLKRAGLYDELVGMLRGGAEHCPSFAGNLNNYAWALATLPRDDLRDGEEAVSVARRAVELLDERRPGFLDTLAVALAEAGRFDEAIEIQNEALRRSADAELPPEVIDQLRQHLARFRAGQPIRSPAPAPAAS